MVESQTRDTPWGSILVFLFSALASATVLYTIEMLRFSLSLHADRLVIHELWRSRTVMRANIESQQTVRLQYPPLMWVLRLKQPRGAKIRLAGTCVPWFKVAKCLQQRRPSGTAPPPAAAS